MVLRANCSYLRLKLVILFHLFNQTIMKIIILITTFFLTILVGKCYAGNPEESEYSIILNDYKLNRYSDVISSVRSDHDITFKKLKFMSYFNLNKFSDLVSFGNEIKESWYSDTLNEYMAYSHYYLGNDVESQSYIERIKSERLKSKLLEIYNYEPIESSYSSKIFKSQSSLLGFDLIEKKLLYAQDNSLFIDGEKIFTSKGKYCAYPFYDQLSRKIYFSSNDFSGELMTEDELKKISRDKISKLQLYVGDYDKQLNKLINISKVSFCKVEYDYLAPFVEGGKLYFSANTDGGFGNFDFYSAEIFENNYSNIKNLGEKINSPGNEIGYCHSVDKAYYSSDFKGRGQLDLIVCNREGQIYFESENMGQNINVRQHDINPRLIEEKLYYYQKNIDGSASIKVIDKLSFKIKAKSIVKNSNNVLLDNSKLIIGENLFEDNPTFYSNKEGEIAYEFDQMKNEKLLVTHYGYQDYKSQTSNKETNSNIILKEKFFGVVEDIITEEPIPGVRVLAKKGNDSIVVYTDEKGNWALSIEENDGWEVTFGKQGLQSKKYSLEKLTIDRLKNIAMGIELKKGAKLEIRSIYFELAKSNITSESYPVLDKIVQYLLENNQVNFEISAHTDSRGSSVNNLKLSEARAKSVYDYLISKDVKISQIVSKGLGETKPINKCKDGIKCSEEEYSLNRRVEFKVL